MEDGLQGLKKGTLETLMICGEANHKPPQKWMLHSLQMFITPI
jgi:hypothetical protein